MVEKRMEKSFLYTKTASKRQITPKQHHPNFYETEIFTYFVELLKITLLALFMITRRNFLKTTVAGGAMVTFGQFSSAKNTISSAIPDDLLGYEGEKQIPIITDVDIVVVGGTGAAVEAAVAASRAGKKVFLVSSLTYLGDDICGSFLYHLKEGENPTTLISRNLFKQSKSPTPLFAKTLLENELIDNGVDFLYSSYLTDVLVDEAGTPSGIVIANRSGRQAIRCKAIIDATQNAIAAKMSGGLFTEFKPGNYTFHFTVVGNQPHSAPEIISSELLPYSIPVNDLKLPVTRYTFSLPVQENTYAALQAAEQIIRDKTWDEDQGDSSDVLEYLPFSSIVPEKPFTGSFTSLNDIPKEAFLPQKTKNVWVLSPAAGVNKTTAEILTRPVYGMALGKRMGELVAQSVQDKTIAAEVYINRNAGKANNYGQVKELLQPLRPSFTGKYAISNKSSLPVLGTYDVVVMGGGTAGAPAGISAAKQGAKTLVLEYLHGLGGLMTLGLIGKYWDGYREGYTKTIDLGVRNMAPLDHPRQHKNYHNDHNSDWKQEWFRRELRNAGADVWFGVLGCGAVVENNAVKGIVVSTPFGRGIILSKVVIDSSGSADIAIAAGAAYEYTGKSVAVQGSGLGTMQPYDYYKNNDWEFIDDSDVLDVSRIFIQARKKVAGNYDTVKLPQTRERRRVVGDYTISVYDVLNNRRYPDTISYHQSSFDTHGMIVDPYFILRPPAERHTIYNADVPIRCLLPKGLEGIITTGLGASADRDAMPIIRMQACLQNQGFAVGYLAALCVKEKKVLRKADIKKVQNYLVGMGNLPSRVLKDKAFKGYSDKEMRQAADKLTNNYEGLDVLLTDTQRCIKFVKAKMPSAASADNKIIYASVLCMLGDSSAVSVLVDKLNSHKEWDEGWNYTGMHQFGTCMSRLDALMIALGNARDASTLPVILEKARLLNTDDYFSHFRAVAMATESIGSKDAVDVLAELLKKPGMRNHYLETYKDARRNVVPDLNDVSLRNAALKELHLCRALYYCGDKNKLGEETLKKYTYGLQGHYARYGGEILNIKR